MLKQYLDDNFKNFTHKELNSHFHKKFGVKVASFGEYYLFNYDQFEVKWDDISSQCRGIILKFENNNWVYKSRPFNKFYNIDEPKNVVSDEMIKLNVDNIELVEKLDGGMIQIWFDEEWKLSTTGRISIKEANDYGVGEELFFKSFDFNRFKSSDLSKEYTYIFELIDLICKNVTSYDKNFISFLTARNNKSGQYLCRNEINRINELLGCKTPKFVKLKDLNIVTAEDIIKWVEKEYSNDSYGNLAEGVCLYINNIPMAKIKREDYKIAHGVLTGSKLEIKNKLINLYFTNKVDDLVKYFDKKHFDFFEELKNNVNTKFIDVEKIYNEVKDIKTKKDYAIKLSKTKSWEKGFLFAMFEKGADLNLKIEFNSWMSENYGQFIKEFEIIFFKFF